MSHPYNGIPLSNKKRQAIDLMTSTWMNLKSFMLTERSQPERLHTIIFIIFKKWKNYRDRNQRLPGAWDGRVLTTKECEDILGVMKIYVLCLQLYNCIPLSNGSNRILKRIYFIVCNLYLNKHDLTKIHQPVQIHCFPDGETGSS